MRKTLLLTLALHLSIVVTSCGSADEASQANGEGQGEAPIVTPPFAVRGDLSGLMLTYLDAEGVHTTEHLSEVPEAARGLVRVDSLRMAPDDRDPDAVYVADLRAPGEGGNYVVRRMTRESFETAAREARPEPTAVATSDEVVVFGASWCGACRQAEAYLRERYVPFVEHDIEREPEARADMQRRARAAGITANGIPIIDIRGRVMQGFDPGAVDRALRETGGTNPAPQVGQAQPGSTI
jgi:glutaredoxin